MLAGNFPGALVGSQFQNSIGRPQPMLCGKITVFDSLQKLAQKRPDTGRQNFQMLPVTTFFLGHGGDQFQFAGEQGNGVKHPDDVSVPFLLNGQFVHRASNTGNPSDNFYVGFQATDLKWNRSHQCGDLHLGWITRSQFQLLGNSLNIRMTSFEINVLTGERFQLLKLRFNG